MQKQGMLLVYVSLCLALGGPAFGRLTAPLDTAAIAAPAAALRNAVDDALAQLRDIILNGDPENGIPVLDPFEIEEQAFAVDEEALQAEGSVADARLTGLGAFEVRRSSISIGIFPPRATIKVAINFPQILAVGNYQVAGNGELNGAPLPIDADGTFLGRVDNLYFSVDVVVTAIGYNVKSCDVSLDLGGIAVEVTGAGALGDLINAEAAARAEQWFNDNRAAIEKELEAIITEAIESGNLRNQLKVVVTSALAA